MKKLLSLSILMFMTACTIQVTDATDEPEEYCYLKKLYYSDVCTTGEYGTQENCNRWLQGACTFRDHNECVSWDQDYYLDVEECTEVYRK